MTKGRKIGQIEVTLDEMEKIVELTEKGLSINQIAKKVGRCRMTVYNYQKKLFS